MRAPIIAGQPITNTSRSCMATPPASWRRCLRRACARSPSPSATDSGAGGFILPNDRVDVILTRKIQQTEPPLVERQTILADVRVLAVDQTFKQDKDTKTVTARPRHWN